MRFDNIEANLDNPPKPTVIYDKPQGNIAYGWKPIRVGPDGKLYVSIGAPCNVCERSEQRAWAIRMDLDDKKLETVAVGVHNTVSFGFPRRYQGAIFIARHGPLGTAPGGMPPTWW